MAHEVFIGYSTPDKKVADAICGILESKGIPCWIAPRDVPIGRFGGVIVEAVTQSKVMVFLFSEHSNRSANCLTEVHTAFNKNIKLIALRLDDTAPSEDMEYYLQLFHWQDAREQPVEKHFDALVSRVEKELAGIAARAEADAKKKVQAEEQAKAHIAAEEAKKVREAAVKTTPEKEPYKPLPKPPARKKTWLWAGSGALAIVAVAAVVLVLMIPRGNTPVPPETPTTTAPTSAAAITTNASTLTSTSTSTPTSTYTPTPTTPTTTPPIATETTTTPPTQDVTVLPPTEYVKITFAPTTFEKTEITGGEPFNIYLSGNFTCLKDISYPVSGLTIVPKMTAINTASQTEITLITSNNITSESIPLKAGERAGFMQTLSLRFPENAAAGTYQIFLNTDTIKVNIGLWVDIDEFFQLIKQRLGTVTYNEI